MHKGDNIKMENKREVSVVEFHGFNSDEVIEFFNMVLDAYEYRDNQYVEISNLSKIGINELDRHVFKKKGGN